jgi:hypothetical protein
MLLPLRPLLPDKLLEADVDCPVLLVALPNLEPRPDPEPDPDPVEDSVCLEPMTQRFQGQRHLILLYQGGTVGK